MTLIFTNDSCKACSTFSAFANQLLLSINLPVSGYIWPPSQVPDFALGAVAADLARGGPGRSRLPGPTSRESSRVSKRVLPPGIGSAKLADSCMLIVALCCFLVPSSGAREAPRRFQTISISKHFFLSMY